MRVYLDRFPGGCSKALTMSYDDGRIHDRKLVEIFNRNGLKGTFHLNSSRLGKEDFITENEVPMLFAGHEVSVHTVTHPSLDVTPGERIAMEILQDRQNLEELVKYPVKGMSYPNGRYSEHVVNMLPSLGIEYARMTRCHGGFELPDHFMLWSPTCHHRDMLEHGDRFLALRPNSKLALFYVWGHSYEFANNNNWELIEQFAQNLGRQPDIWYATNAEIVAYVQALKQLRFSVSGSWVHNPTALSLWLSADGAAMEVKAGDTVALS